MVREDRHSMWIRSRILENIICGKGALQASSPPQCAAFPLVRRSQRTMCSGTLHTSSRRLKLTLVLANVLVAHLTPLSCRLCADPLHFVVLFPFSYNVAFAGRASEGRPPSHSTTSHTLTLFHLPRSFHFYYSGRTPHSFQPCSSRCS